MRTQKIHVTTTVLLSLLTPVLWLILEKPSEVRAAEDQDKQETQTQRPQGDGANLPKGVIGVSLHVGRNVSVSQLCYMWPMCILRAQHSKQASSMEMRW